MGAKIAVLTRKEIAEGRLAAVLPAWKSGKTHCCALYPAHATPHALSRRFVDFLFTRMQAMRLQEEGA